MNALLVSREGEPIALMHMAEQLRLQLDGLGRQRITVDRPGVYETMTVRLIAQTVLPKLIVFTVDEGFAMSGLEKGFPTQAILPAANASEVEWRPTIFAAAFISTIAEEA